MTDEGQAICFVAMRAIQGTDPENSPSFQQSSAPRSSPTARASSSERCPVLLNAVDENRHRRQRQHGLGGSLVFEHDAFAKIDRTGLAGCMLPVDQRQCRARQIGCSQRIFNVPGASTRFGRLSQVRQKLGAGSSYSGGGGWDCFDGTGMPRRAVASGHRSSREARARYPGGRRGVQALSPLFFRHGEA